MNQKIYPMKSVEREPLEREILVHGAMLYKCECCGKIFQMWLEKGLEDKNQDAINPSSHKPAPFTIGCLCGGTMQHIAWQNDIHLGDYRPLKEHENYFENSPDRDCGISHIRNDIDFRIVEMPRKEYEEIEKLYELFEKGIEWNPNKEIEPETEEDDPYGLAHVSTTTLKAELRRRKRWK